MLIGGTPKKNYKSDKLIQFIFMAMKTKTIRLVSIVRLF